MSTLFPDLKSEAAPLPPKRSLQRHRTHPCDKWIRKVKGNRWQLRIWLGQVSGCAACSVNCGLYESDRAAERAKSALSAKLPADPSTWTPLVVWQALTPLISRGIVPAKVLPMWVRKAKKSPSGTPLYFAQVPSKIDAIRTGEYVSPEEAHRAAVAMLEKLGRGLEREGSRGLEWHWRKLQEAKVADGS